MTPYEMELELLNMGYDKEYLDTLGDSAIVRLWEDETKED